jgi:uncharacterized RDD family membrane protein YckC
MNWFYAYEGQSLGPVDDSELAHLAVTGRINASTLVWNNGLPDWRPYGEVAPPQPAAGMPPALPSSGASARSLLAVAGAALPYSETALPYAGFWVRVAATIFDGLILTPVYVVVFIAFFVEFPDFLSGDDARGGGWRMLFQLLVLVFTALYETFFVGTWGATPGKMICDLRVVRADGARVSYLRAFCRYFAKCLNQATFMLGYVIVAFDSEKRGLHDYICSTRVIHTRPSTE